MKYVKSYATGEYEEKKSRFIGEVFPIQSVDEAEALIQQVRKKYYDARHHCYAYVLGDQYEIVKQSDDGEPSQTAGMPILNVLKGEEIHRRHPLLRRHAPRDGRPRPQLYEWREGGARCSGDPDRGRGLCRAGGDPVYAGRKDQVHRGERRDHGGECRLWGGGFDDLACAGRAAGRISKSDTGAVRRVHSTCNR